MKDHFALMLLFSALASLVFAYLTKSGNLERFKYFWYLLASFVLLSVVAGWLMYPFPL